MGVDIVQLRDKLGTTREILKFSSQVLKYLKGKIPYIINDRVDLAKVTQADGVHLGQDDLPIDYARKLLGKRAIIGMSCQDLNQARGAEKRGADYIGFGSVFQTLTKPHRRPMDLELLSRVSYSVRIPLFAIGGIDFKNLDSILNIGVKRVAVTRAICLSDNVKEATRKFYEKLTLHFES